MSRASGVPGGQSEHGSARVIIIPGCKSGRNKQGPARSEALKVVSALDFYGTHRQQQQMKTETAIRKRLAASGAILFAVGMVTGLWAAAVLTNKVTVGMPRLALAAHLNGLLGGLWLVAVAWTFEFLSYEAKGLRRLAFAVAIPAWANWLVTLIASFFGVNGLEYTGNRANDVVAFLLQALVVIPTLIGAGLWAWGFKGKSEA